MPRARLFRTSVLPYHVSARSNNKDWFYLPIREMWDIFGELLETITVQFSVQVHAFVLMSNHFHLVITTPKSNLDEAMLYLLREAAKEVNRRTGRINHLFGAPYHRSVIAHRKYFEQGIRYIYQNPVKAGVVEKVQDYPYSSLYFLIRNRELNFQIVDSVFERTSVLDLAVWQRLDFLNQRYSTAERDVLRKGLRNPVFKVANQKVRSSMRNIAHLKWVDNAVGCTKVGRTN